MHGVRCRDRGLSDPRETTRALPPRVPTRARLFVPSRFLRGRALPSNPSLPLRARGGNARMSTSLSRVFFGATATAPSRARTNRSPARHRGASLLPGSCAAPSSFAVRARAPGAPRVSALGVGVARHRAKSLTRSRPRGPVAPRASVAVPAAAAAAGAAEVAASTTATAVAGVATNVAVTGGSFWGYFLSFLFGGVFFSTALGVAALFISIGASNVQRAWRVFQFLSSRVWVLIAQTAVAVKASLQAEGETLADTRKVLEEGYAATKKEVNESLRAFNQERDFYAAAVGIPGLRTAQYVIDHMMPGLIAAKLERSLAQSISVVKHPNVKRMILKSVAAGRAAPLLTGARFYDVGDGAMAFDVDVKWVSDITADMDVVPAMGLPAEGLARVPVFVHDVKFDGTVRVLMARLSREDPGYGAIVLSFPDPPYISLDVRVGGGLEVNRVPWLRKVVSDATKTWIKEEMLWPRRMLIPAERPVMEKGGKPENVLSDAELARVLAEDPLMLAEAQLMSLQEIATGELGTKKSSGDIEQGDDGWEDPDVALVDVEVTDPDHPRPEKPVLSARDRALSWLGGATKVTVDKTIEVGRGAMDTGIKAATSKETKRAIAAVAETPKNLGSWWERDAKGWLNNVAARATGGKSKTDHRGFPAASAWTEAPEANADGTDTNGEVKKNGAQAPGAVDGVTSPTPSEKNE